MRRNYIAPEFTYNRIYGTFNMLESSSFFGSKMLEIEDVISILNKNIIYYQSSNNEQIDLIIETNNSPIIFNTVDIKGSMHSLKIDESQSTSDREKNTKWIMEISISDILTEYIFATLKEYRTFEGVKNNMTIYNDVNAAIKEYIKRNVLSRYKFTTIDLYIKYRDLRSQNILRYKNDFSQLIESTENKVKRIQSNITYDDSLLTINFSQEKESNKYSFEYYYNIFFEKI